MLYCQPMHKRPLSSCTPLERCELHDSLQGACLHPVLPAQADFLVTGRYPSALPAAPCPALEAIFCPGHLHCADFTT